MSIYSCSGTVSPAFQENFSILRRRPFPAFSPKQHRICVYSTPTNLIPRSPLPPPSALTHPAVADWKRIDIFLILRRGWRVVGGLLHLLPTKDNSQSFFFSSPNKNNEAFIELAAGMFPSSPGSQTTWLSRDGGDGGGGVTLRDACCKSRSASV